VAVEVGLGLRVPLGQPPQLRAESQLVEAIGEDTEAGAKSDPFPVAECGNPLAEDLLTGAVEPQGNDSNGTVTHRDPALMAHRTFCDFRLEQDQVEQILEGVVLPSTDTDGVLILQEYIKR
jgi:hypothetical protein